MPMYDFDCTSPSCGHHFEALAPIGTLPPCRACGGPTTKVWRDRCANLIPDDVPGGFTIENLDPVPRTFYSKSAYRHELAARGLTTAEGNQWRGDPGNGSDKPRNGLSRWF